MDIITDGLIVIGIYGSRDRNYMLKRYKEKRKLNEDYELGKVLDKYCLVDYSTNLVYLFLDKRRNK